MPARKQLHLLWENLDEHLFLSACELAEGIVTAADDPDASFTLNLNRELARAELRLHKVLPQLEALARLWQIVKAWRTTHANEDMREWLSNMRELADCHAAHAALPDLACRTCNDRNLRFAGCKRVLPALGPLDIEQPFELGLTYWDLGAPRTGGWVFRKHEIREAWMRFIRAQGLHYCPRFAGLVEDFAELPHQVRCGPAESWRLARLSAWDDLLFAESTDGLIAVPRDVPLPAGYQLAKV